MIVIQGVQEVVLQDVRQPVRQLVPVHVIQIVRDLAQAAAVPGALMHVMDVQEHVRADVLGVQGAVFQLVRQDATQDATTVVTAHVQELVLQDVVQGALMHVMDARDRVQEAVTVAPDHVSEDVPADVTQGAMTAVTAVVV